MNPQTRTQRNTIKTRTRQQRATARITRRGNASLTTYGIANGLTTRDARSMASTLRKEAKALWIDGTEHRVHTRREIRTTHRYTPAQVALIATMYQPRKPAYKLIRARLTLAA